MAARYLEGANVNELATEFRCARQTVALRLKTHGIIMRNQPATPEEIARVVSLYASGLSLVGVAEQTRFSPKSVLNYLRAEGIQLRDTHGRPRETLINRRAWDLMGRPGLSGWMVDQWVLSRVNDVLAR